MNKNTKTVSQDTVIGENPVTLGEYRAFFEKAISKEFSSNRDFNKWLNSHTRKTLKEAVEVYYKTPEHKSIKELLSEQRFNIISEPDKAFIMAFDEEMNRLGYDYGGSVGSGYCWGRFMIIYAKTGAKNIKVSARIFIRDNSIVLRLYFSNINDHREYIKSAPAYIKAVFTGDHAKCNMCKDKCSFRKEYTIDGRFIQKCSGVAFEFWEPTKEKLPDYTNLLSEFYSNKRNAARS